MEEDSPRKKPGAGLALLKKLLAPSGGDSASPALSSPPGGAGSSPGKRFSLSVGDGGAGKSKWGDVTKRKASLMVLGEGLTICA
ncbi:hypothetical protein RRG08_061119 [Elysia crispata]|uniref:Uncharacterized protein n=1 Tax=Elysia crispata TaxID=231223 RepID=A0AAE1CED0_9GAST|nr:hypothetical protein RRG08_061119 [Elysia crispata]